MKSHTAPEHAVLNEYRTLGELTRSASLPAPILAESHSLLIPETTRFNRTVDVNGSGTSPESGTPSPQVVISRRNVTIGDGMPLHGSAGKLNTGANIEHH
jgi:hypothetical protein